mgnify:CR=1 FL=1
MAKKKKIIVTPPVVETINEQALEELMGERYAAYAKYVIQDRAIPDARDGLKPVQRRIIYAMYHSGNLHRKPYRKCAASVGEVMGKLGIRHENRINSNGNRRLMYPITYNHADDNPVNSACPY